MDDPILLLIHRYLDGSLGDEDTRRLEAALAADPGLRRRMAEASFDHALMQRMLRAKDVARTAVRQASPRRARTWSFAAAAVILVAVGAGWVVRELRQESPAAVLVAGTVEVEGRRVERIPKNLPVQVAAGSVAELRLEDGSRASLDPQSEIVLRGHVGQARQVVELVRGVGTFTVEKSSRSFRVDTEVGQVTVLGTEFKVDLRTGKRGRMKVSVTSGTVSVDSRGKTQQLHAGQSAEFGEQDPPPAGVFRGVVQGEVVAPKTEFNVSLKVVRVVSVAQGAAPAPGAVLRVSGNRVRKPDPNSSARWEGAFIKKVQLGQSIEIDLEHKEKDDYHIGELTPEQIRWAQQK